MISSLPLRNVQYLDFAVLSLRLLPWPWTIRHRSIHGNEAVDLTADFARGEMTKIVCPSLPPRPTDWWGMKKRTGADYGGSTTCHVLMGPGAL